MKRPRVSRKRHRPRNEGVIVGAVNDLVIKIGTVNGTGSASANGLLMKSIFRMGIPVVGKNYFPSNIQGLPTWYEVRASKDGYTSRSGRVDVMVAMNAQTYAKDLAEVIRATIAVIDDPNIDVLDLMEMVPGPDFPTAGYIYGRKGIHDAYTTGRGIIKIRAKAADGDRFGFGTGEIAVRLPVLVQPALPRFVRPGDQFTASALGRVVEGDGGDGAAQIEIEGAALRGDAKTSIALDPSTPTRIGFPVTSRTDSNAPPLASPSAFVRMTPVSGSASLNAFAELTAS